MSTTPPPNGPGEPTWTPPPPAPPLGDRTRGFFDSIRSWGYYRSEERWVGGVAGGLALRSGFDPLLTRGLTFVLILVFPFLLTLYGLAWLMLPEQRDGRIHLQEAFRGDFSAGFAGSVVFTILGLSPDRTDFGPWRFTNSGWILFLVPLAIVLIAFAIAGRGPRNPDRHNVTPPSSFAAPPSSYTAPPTSYTAPQEPVMSAAPSSVTAEPRWTQPPAPVQRPPANPIPMVALALWLLGTAGLWLADRAGTIAVPMFPASLALLVIVSGLGIIANGLTGRTAGGLAAAAVFGAIIGLPAAMWSGAGFPSSPPDTWFGEQSWAPATADEASSGQSVAFGELNVDLTRMDLTQSVTIPLSVSFGQVDVIIPDDVRVEANINYGAGSVNWLGNVSEGALNGSVSYDNGVSANRGDPVVTLQIQVAVGEANVTY